jgi:hypothetical protein
MLLPMQPAALFLQQAGFQSAAGSITFVAAAHVQGTHLGASQLYSQHDKLATVLLLQQQQEQQMLPWLCNINSWSSLSHCMTHPFTHVRLGTLQESVVEVEYVPAVVPPEPQSAIPQDDW